MYDEVEPITHRRNQNALGNNKYFDPKMGAAGAVVMSGIVYYINSEYGIDAASFAATKQAVYTFFLGGLMMKFSENLSIYFNSDSLAKATSVLVPTALTVGLTYLVHSMKGTPEPFESTIPTMFLAPVGFLWWGHKKRKQLEELVSEQNNKRNNLNSNPS